ncbi:hypothetical protein Dsin_021432 [Dipteronia sinensis]|uniref:KIB1-4 beta-propeller domain-containing protein n=1 Tax=Dipteronia sinensis TaxID=43782 RepID=A0AAE0A0J5_9ROSI|nr:hypothetical protein Dsin_021432 [Dipteronia sinensis]
MDITKRPHKQQKEDQDRDWTRLPGGDPNKQNCVYMLLSYTGLYFNVWIQEAKDWCKCDLDVLDDYLIDLICFNGFFYLLTEEYNIRVLNAAYAYSTIQTQGYKTEIDTQFFEIEISLDIPRESEIFHYLVECGEEILLVLLLREFIHVTYDFMVYRLDMCIKKWVKLDSLEDCVMFLGRSSSRCYSAKELGGDDMRNCIYFTSCFRSSMDWENKLSCYLEKDYRGVFRLNSDGSERFSYLAKRGKKRQPFWLTAPMWWYFIKFRP